MLQKLNDKAQGAMWIVVMLLAGIFLFVSPLPSWGAAAPSPILRPWGLRPWTPCDLGGLRHPDPLRLPVNFDHPPPSGGVEVNGGRS